APSGASDPPPQAPSAAETPRFGQTLQSGHSEETVLMDITGQDGTIPAGPQIPKDGVKRRNRCGAAKKRARKAKAERELQLAPHTEVTPNANAPQPGGSLVGSNDCDGGTGDKGGPAPINLKRRRNETVTPPEIPKEWLEAIVPSLKPLDGASLEILDKERIPKLRIMTAIFRDTNEE
ncbi:hypothetical protein PV326_002082, partial [Microctonus aethiopoides]